MPRLLIWVFTLILTVSLISPVEGSPYKFIVTPNTLFFEIEPGNVSSQVIRVTSTATTDIVVKVTAAGIIKDWISINNTDHIKLEPDESRAINVQVTVPSNAEPGDHTGSVNFHQVMKGRGSTAISVGVGVRATVTVPGLVIEKGEIVSFPNVTVVEGKEEAIFNVAFENTGTITTMATALVRVLDSSGQIVAEGFAHVTNPVKPFKTIIFIVSCSIGDLSAGNYTCISTVFFGSEGKAVESEAELYIKPEHLYVMPVTWTLAYMASLILVIVAILILIRARRASSQLN